MSCDCVVEVERVQTVGACGIGVYPPVEAETVDSVGAGGIGKVSTGAGPVYKWQTESGGTSGGTGESDIFVLHVVGYDQVEGSFTGLEETWNEIAAAISNDKALVLNIPGAASSQEDGSYEITSGGSQFVTADLVYESSSSMYNASILSIDGDARILFASEDPDAQLTVVAEPETPGG